MSEKTAYYNFIALLALNKYKVIYLLLLLLLNLLILILFLPLFLLIFCVSQFDLLFFFLCFFSFFSGLDENGCMVAKSTGIQQSSRLMSMSSANALLCLPQVCRGMFCRLYCKQCSSEVLFEVYLTSDLRVTLKRQYCPAYCHLTCFDNTDTY